MDAKWTEKAGEVVMVLSALASIVNHVVRARQAEGQAVAGWLFQLNALLNVGALNLDKAVQQFKAAKTAGSKVNVISILLSLFKGKAPAVEAVLEKAAEVEAKVEVEAKTEEKVELTVSTPSEEQLASLEEKAAVVGIAGFANEEEGEVIAHVTKPKKKVVIKAKAVVKKPVTKSAPKKAKK